MVSLPGPLPGSGQCKPCESPQGTDLGVPHGHHQKLTDAQRVILAAAAEQDFNSLEAQREACESYIKSQAHEGWSLVGEHFDDGGFSGGNMDRPALRRLMDRGRAPRHHHEAQRRDPAESSYGGS